MTTSDPQRRQTYRQTPLMKDASNESRSSGPAGMSEGVMAPLKKPWESTELVRFWHNIPQMHTVGKQCDEAERKKGACKLGAQMRNLVNSFQIESV